MLASEWRENRSKVCEAGREVAGDHPMFAPPELATRSAWLFHRDLSRAVNAILLLTQVVVFADNAAQVASKVVNGDFGNLPKDFDPFQPLGSAGGPFWRKLKTVEASVFEMTFVRLIDNFTSYLSDVLRECLTARPEILKSERQLKFETILQFDSMDELLAHMIDRTVDDLAYTGFPALSEWIGSKLGIANLKNFPARNPIIEYIEARNCIVHNRSAISPKYARLCGLGIDLVGFPISVELSMMTLGAQATWECVTMLDPILAQKFKLDFGPELRMGGSHTGSESRDVSRR